MEHLDTGTLENWYANRAKPAPALLQRLAVIAPDDAPGLLALRQRLAQRGPQSLNCDHFAAGFNGSAGDSLVSAFEQIRQRHAAEPYDIVLLLEGRPEALGIAESNGLIPEQVSRMPAPVWTAIGEDDANTELGDVAHRVFPNPAALIDALPLQAARVQPHAAVGAAAAANDADRQPVEAPVFSLVTTPDDAAASHLPVLPSRQTAAPERTGAHPLVLCAAGAVIVASMTAVAAMLGWLPMRVQADAGIADRPVTAAPAPAARVVNAVDAPAAAPAAAAVPESLPEPAPLPMAPSTPSTPQPQGSGIGEGAALAAVGAAGLAAATPRTQAAPAKRVKRAPRRQQEAASEQALAPRQVGSTEVPATEFVGTKSRQQVIAELMEARRAASRQAANNYYFPGLGGPNPRR